MSYADNPYRSSMQSYADMAVAGERSDFIAKTYAHLVGAVGLFVILEMVWFRIPGIEDLVATMLFNRISWLIVIGAFVGVSYLAETWARSTTSQGMQYAGLALYVAAESVIFIPILYLAQRMDSQIIPTAAVGTLGLFGLLTLVVFVTRQDFSFLRTVLLFGGLAAMGFIVVALVFNFAPGIVFTYAMIALACGYILYHTSNVMYHYRIGQHVAASLALFASVALLFWYILQLYLSRRN